jgi:hypothetical protein
LVSWCVLVCNSGECICGGDVLCDGVQLLVEGGGG